MPRRIIPALRILAPRIIALGWAAWAASTAWAYIDGAPPQLQRVENALHIEVWALWAVSAVMLFAGGTIPASGERLQSITGWLRGGGLALSAGLLGLWAVEFFITDSTRGWVSGKNYLLLAACALSHSWWVGRHRAPGKREA